MQFNKCRKIHKLIIIYHWSHCALAHWKSVHLIIYILRIIHTQYIYSLIIIIDDIYLKHTYERRLLYFDAFLYIQIQNYEHSNRQHLHSKYHFETNDILPSYYEWKYRYFATQLKCTMQLLFNFNLLHFSTVYPNYLSQWKSIMLQ